MHCVMIFGQSEIKHLNGNVFCVFSQSCISDILGLPELGLNAISFHCIQLYSKKKLKFRKICLMSSCGVNTNFAG